MSRVIRLLLLVVLLSVSVVVGQYGENDCNTVRLCEGETLDESLQNTAMPHGCSFGGVQGCEGVEYPIDLYICSSQNMFCPTNGGKCEDPTRDAICTRRLKCKSPITGWRGTVYQPIYAGKDTCCKCLLP